MSQEDLIPFNKRTEAEQKEITRKGGIASGEARRKKRDRHARIKYLFNLAIENPKIKDSLEKMGVDVTDADLETAADARVLLEVLKKGDYKAWSALKEEAYGPQDRKQQLELSGEVTGININVKKYDKEDA